ncbi:MAG: NHL repeat-containing protein, partial [Blastocatellia bacterium]
GNATPQPSPTATPGDSAADYVAGQIDFAATNPNFTDGNGVIIPAGIAIDPSNGYIYVADTGNNRVLGWQSRADFIQGKPPVLVIGQPNLNSSLCNDSPQSILPTASTLCFSNSNGTSQPGLAVGTVVGKKYLYVADPLNNRVLEFPDPSTTKPPYAADRVFGQGDSTTNACNNNSSSSENPAVDQSTLCDPQGIGLDALGDLFVADTGNSRVLEFPASTAQPEAASLVFGQSSFTTNPCDNAGIAANVMCNPDAVAVDSSGNLDGADTGNNRVLEFTVPSSIPSGGIASTKVFGQSGFLTGTCNSGGVSASTLCNPVGIAIASDSSVYIVDGGNNRILKYAPGSVLMTQVFGQSNFSSASCNFGKGPDGADATSLCFQIDPASAAATYAGAIALDASQNLYVSDAGNNRVLEFDNPSSTPTATPTSTATATPTTTPTLTPSTTPTSSSTPTATATATPAA